MPLEAPLADPLARDLAAEPVDGVSVVVPIHNEEENLPRLHEELTAALARVGKPYEIILVDDGSRDGSARLMEGIAARDGRVKLVLLRRNYGQTSALRAGMDRARFGAIVTIDGDLQNDPADIPAMVARLEEGHDLVAGWRRDRQDARLTRKLPSRLANGLIRRVTGVPIRDLGCTLKVIRREFLSELELYGDMHRFVSILMVQRGARWTEMPTSHRPRVAGVTKYGLWRTVVVLLDLITLKYLLDYSAHPMRLFGGLGLLALGVSILALLGAVGMKLAGGVDMSGNPLLLLTVLSGLSALQLFSLGLLSEVLVRIYYGRQEARTHYSVRRTANLGDEG
ncbi:glycosyltransferase family 2 protein [Rubellimicrobium aerolatum]|uniref:Glycosyltransferase family 2 protein n=1 Tax=Rubellimicrobium aerolatum TaxID=490979 RepID=A0ABW0S9K6_9RHOB|nr:glycosyltransferase family 2 protein [Rubellimicrobium aerolatum]MBP1804947.1 glycosyltransferase involved in cell wall biosynthesis [Rubellimicrobium aerolatum]